MDMKKSSTFRVALICPCVRLFVMWSPCANEGHFRHCQEIIRNWTPRVGWTLRGVLQFPQSCIISPGQGCSSQPPDNSVTEPLVQPDAPHCLAECDSAGVTTAKLVQNTLGDEEVNLRAFVQLVDPIQQLRQHPLPRRDGLNKNILGNLWSGTPQFGGRDHFWPIHFLANPFFGHPGFGQNQLWPKPIVANSNCFWPVHF